MSRTLTRYHQVRASPHNGAAVDLSDAVIEGRLYLGEHAVGIGPLIVEPFPHADDTTLALEGIRFEGAEGLTDETTWLGGLFDGLFGAAALGGLVALDTETERKVSRRQVIGLGALALGLSGTVSAEEDLDERDVATMHIDKSPGIRIRIADAVSDVLPRSTRYTVYLNGSETASFMPKTGSAILPPGGVGDLRIAGEAEAERSVGEWLDGLLDEPPPNRYEVELAKPPADIDVGTEMVLTDAPHVVDSVEEAGADDTQVVIGTTSIPHESETDDGRGFYRVTAEDELVYVVGAGASESTTVTVTTGEGYREELKDDIERKLQL